MTLNKVIRIAIFGLLITNLPNVLVAAAPGPMQGETQSGKSFYVATNGNDAWSGTLPEPNQAGTDGPFASITAARDAIRKLGTPATTGPVTVFFRGGTYVLPETVVLGHLDSGTKQSPRIYKAYQKEIPILSSGQEIRGWKRVNTLADLPRGGVGAPALQENLWMAEVPGVAEGKWNFHQLFTNGERRQRARTPNTGYFLVDGMISGETPARFKFHPGDIDQAWAVGGNAEVVALINWGGFRLKLKNVDPASNTATLSARRQAWGWGENARYWVENIPQALDAPGEWYLDRATGVVYYHAMPNEDMSHIAAIAPVLPQLIRLEGDAEGESEELLAHNISLEGLTFSYTDWNNATTGLIHSFVEWSKPEDGHIDEQSAIDIPAAVEGVGAHMVSINKCVFIHLGGYAVDFHGGSKENSLTKSMMTDLGAGGVRIGDGKAPSFDAQATSKNVVSDNTIHDIGKVYLTGTGIWVGSSGGNTIAHNEIYDTSYIGISVGWSWSYGPSWARDNIIEFNNIYNISRGVLSDLGCIYTVGVSPGTIIRNNLCHDVSRYEHGYGGWGIYTDEGSSEIVIENNVVYRTLDGGFHQNYGRNNVIRNNVMALGQTAQLKRTHNEDHMTLLFEHNIFYWKDGKMIDGNWDGSQYKFDNNLYYQEGGKAVEFDGKSFAEWKKSGQDVHSIVAAPLFVDPEHGDFSLKPGSPALKIGFKPIDISGVGPRKD